MDSVEEIPAEPAPEADLPVPEIPLVPLVAEVSEPQQPEEEDFTFVVNEAKTKKGGVGKTIISVVLSILLFITLLVSVAIFGFRNAIQEDSLVRLVDNVSLSDFLGDSGELQQFYEFMDNRFDVKVNNRKLEEFIEESSLKEFVAEKVSDFGEDFFDGDAELSITKPEVEKLLQKNSNVIREELGVYLDSTDLREIATWLFDEDEVVLLSTDSLKKTSPALYYVLNFGLSYLTMIVFLLLSALIVFFMIKNSLSQAACGIGIDFVVLGGVTGLIALIVVALFSLWDLLFANSVIGILLGNFMVVNFLISIVLLVLGVALLITRAILLRRNKNREA